MALTIHPPCFPNKPHYTLFQFHTKSKFSVRSQDPSAIDEPSSTLPPPKKPTSPGQGFGSSPSSPSKTNASTVRTKKKQSSGNRERASIIRRRPPVEKPGFVSEQGEGESKAQGRNESAFLLTWLGLGAVILVEGIALAASGFLPEKWDQFFVKYLYPSFTPTVFLFVAGTVAYGVLKYLQNEGLKDQK